MSAITIDIPEVECPECGDPLDLEECEVIIIVICSRCKTAFEAAEDEGPKYH